ncbi:MAG: ribonuclease P protein component [Candidatus Nanopelagicales bacterium]
MLASENRLRRSTDFQSVSRRGIRVSRSCLVIHVIPPPANSALLTRVGLSVGKGVGGSVVRHRVARRLRSQMRGLLGALPSGSTVVVRALPPAATASSRLLGEELVSALASAATKLSR